MKNVKIMQSRPKEFATDNGIQRNDREILAKHLTGALADTYLLYIKTQGFHWNAVGPLFYDLHKMTEEQYQDLATSIDNIAERIRAIGFTAPYSYEQFRGYSDIVEEAGTPSAEEMVEQLALDNEACSRNMRIAVGVAEEAGDVKTADLLTSRIGQHEQNTWMLRAILS